MITDGGNARSSTRLLLRSPTDELAALRAVRDTQQNKPRAAIFTGSYGAGHDSAAYEIRERLIGDGWLAEIIDVADLYPARLGHLLKRMYFAQLRFAPKSWDRLLKLMDSHDCREKKRALLGKRLTALSGRLPSRAIGALIGDRTDVAISTHPFASQALGLLRRNKIIDTLTVTYLTDASAHPLWINENVDVHIAVHDEAARQAIARGAKQVHVVQPLTPAVAPPTGTEAAAFRARLGLSPDARIALISGGSEGAGDVGTSARHIRETGVATPVVLCGHNDRLRRKLEREPGVVAVGWLNGLTEAIRASECVIQNSGGFTTLEAFALGTPVISYACLPGHGQQSAEALRVEGLAPWPKTKDELKTCLTEAVAHGHGAVARRWSQRPTLLDVLNKPGPKQIAS
jgi:processive 1,2-diacylglycerol beta-glucosyltransferase